MLNEIARYKRQEVKDLKGICSLSEIRKTARGRGDDLRSLWTAIKKKGNDREGTNIIGEIKKASPSKGIICRNFNPLEIAGIYEKNGISAVSILTDRHFFQGDIAYLSYIKDNISLPLLRKDFIIDEYQIFESRVCYADAILLIAAILDKNQLGDYLCLSKELGLDVLVEVHNMEDIEKIAPFFDIISIVGINNRDLKTFHVDIGTTKSLIKELPKDKVIVSESGINTKKDIKELIETGVDAFLIGEAFMRDTDMKARVKEFVSIFH